MSNAPGLIELRLLPIDLCPDGQSLNAEYQRQTGCPLTYKRVYFVAGRPVYSGSTLEVYLDGDWISGRYSADPWQAEPPMLDTGRRIVSLDQTMPLRWPSI